MFSITRVITRVIPRNAETFLRKIPSADISRLGKREGETEPTRPVEETRFEERTCPSRFLMRSIRRRGREIRDPASRASVRHSRGVASPYRRQRWPHSFFRPSFRPKTPERRFQFRIRCASTRLGEFQQSVGFSPSLRGSFIATSGSGSQFNPGGGVLRERKREREKKVAGNGIL